MAMDDLLGADQDGDNRLARTRHGVMLYNRHDTIVGRSMAYYGEYFEQEAALFRQLVRPGDVVVDIGANIGAHALPLARYVGPAGRVLAFEPVRLNFQLLCANMALNGITWADCFHAGLGAIEETLMLPDVAMAEDGNYGALALPELVRGAGDKQPVPVKRLDDVFRYDKLRFIKIDVEGMEEMVLQGAESVLARFQPALYVENDRPDNSQALIERLQSLGYACFWFLPGFHNPANFRGVAKPLYDSGFVDDGTRLVGRGLGINLLCVPQKAAGSLQGLMAVRDAKEHPLNRGDNPRFTVR